MANQWIRGAVKNSHGQFRQRAHRAGLTTQEAAKKWAKKPGKIGAQARLAKTLMGLNKK